MSNLCPRCLMDLNFYGQRHEVPKSLCKKTASVWAEQSCLGSWWQSVVQNWKGNIFSISEWNPVFGYSKDWKWTLTDDRVLTVGNNDSDFSRSSTWPLPLWKLNCLCPPPGLFWCSAALAIWATPLHGLGRSAASTTAPGTVFLGQWLLGALTVPKLGRVLWQSGKNSSFIHLTCLFQKGSRGSVPWDPEYHMVQWNYSFSFPF